jgi:hypothetical protein
MILMLVAYRDTAIILRSGSARELVCRKILRAIVRHGGVGMTPVFPDRHQKKFLVVRSCQLGAKRLLNHPDRQNHGSIRMI